MRNPVLERVLRVVPRLLVLTAPAGYLKTTTAFAYARVFKSHAVVDLARTRDARELLLALLQTLEGGSVDDAYLRQAQLSLAADGDVPQSLADRVLDAWRDPGAPAAVVFDNAELLEPNLRPLLNEILERRPAYRTCIVCSGVPLELRTAQIAQGADFLGVETEDLAFSEEQTRELFAGTQVPRAQLQAVIECAGGWPLLTLLLRHVHAQGRLTQALAQAKPDLDPQRRYAIIQEQALESLTQPQLRAVAFCASVAGAQEDDVRTCLASSGADALRGLPSSFPLLWRYEHRIEVHPLARAVIAAQNPHAPDDLRAAARLAVRRGEPVSAAQRYLACGDRDQAARILDDMLERGATADVASLAVLLDSDTLKRHPRWFTLLTFLRRYDRPPPENLARIRAELEHLDPGSDEMTQLAVGSIEAHQLLHAGQLRLAQERLHDLRRIVTRLKRGGIINALRAHVASRFVDTLTAGLMLAAGEAERAERLLKRVRFMLGQFPMINLSAVADGWLLIGLLRADADLIRSQCARARESLTRSGLDMVLLDLDANEAFAGWVIGDDATYRESLNRLDVRARTYHSRGFDHVLGCVGLRPESQASGLEPLRRLVIAHLFAASRTKDVSGLAHAQRAFAIARELNHALFITLAAIAVRERGGEPGARAGELMELSPQTEASLVSRFR